MKLFQIRPYYGYDCNSEQGFNNGNYLDAIEIEADTETDAINEAMQEFLAENKHLKDTEINGNFGENTIYWEYNFTDINGEEFTKEAYDSLEEEEKGGYCYEYIDFNNIELKEEDN